MNEFQAAMGICNLRHLDREIEKRKVLAQQYDQRLGKVDGIQLCKTQAGVAKNYAYYPVVFDGYQYNRDEMFSILSDKNIFARKYFYPLTSSYECYAGQFDADKTPIAKHISESILTLPLYADLSLEDVNMICDIILS